MECPANLESVTQSFERPLTVDEKRVVPQWVGTAWRKLLDAVPTIPARVELPETLPDGSPHPSHISVDSVRDAVHQIVERKLRNPDMLRSWTGDTSGFTIDSTASAGKIYVSQDEIDMFRPKGAPGASGMFSIPLGLP
jgi:hypothetical protein